MLALATSTARADDVPDLTGAEALARGAIVVEWDAVAERRLAVSAPSRDVEVVIEARVTLGPLSFAWSQGSVSIPSSTTEFIAIEPPPEAYLHESASRYVSALYVRVLERVPAATDTMVASEQILLLWRDGPAAAPLGLRESDFATIAPMGTTEVLALSPALQEAIAGAIVTFSAPIPPMRAGPAEDEGRTRETVPVDEVETE